MIKSRSRGIMPRQQDDCNLDEVPFQSMNSADGGVCQLIESSGREVQSTKCTSCATICDSDGDGLALVYKQSELVKYEIE